MNETSEISRGGAAVAEVRAEVDELSEQVAHFSLSFLFPLAYFQIDWATYFLILVSALQAVVYSGNKVEERDIVYLTEMLMRQLLKLDSIEAQGEGKFKESRRSAVSRVLWKQWTPLRQETPIPSATAVMLYQ